MSIDIRNVSKRFGSFAAVDGVNLSVPTGSLLALLGPSGSGKTTLLRIIAGLEVADSGTVAYQQQDITNLSARDRKVGFVFQHYALFRHMTIADNVGYGLRVRGVPRAERLERVNELLKLVRLEGLAGRYPAQLSGGQRQRIALARALAAKPSVLLLDEPFGALDAKVRQELRQWLRRLHDEIQVTSVFVTHDQEEAFEVADRVVVMNNGRIEQVGSPAEVFEQPANPFVMDFLGNVNVFNGRVERGKAVAPGLEVAYPDYPHAEAQEAKVYVRPHEWRVRRQKSDTVNLGARVLHVNATGSMVKLELRAIDSGQVINAELTTEGFGELGVSPGDTVFVGPRRVRVFLDAAPVFAQALDGLRAAAGPAAPRSVPRRSDAIAVLEHLGTVIFPEFRTDGAPRPNPTEDLHELADSLQALIAAERHATCPGDSEASRCEACAPEAERLTMDVITRLPELRALLNDDLQAALRADPAAHSPAEVALCYPGFRAITVHRIAHTLWQAGAPLVARLLAEESHTRTGVDLHPAARIGPRFFIDHGTGVVVGETAVIGADVRLSQGVTLGGSLPEGAPPDSRRHPQLEDGVVVHANTSIVGAVVIGRGAVVQGNAWITSDLPAAAARAPVRSVK
jgi:sulfate transport system ATP-binding protein